MPAKSTAAGRSKPEGRRRGWSQLQLERPKNWQPGCLGRADSSYSICEVCRYIVTDPMPPVQGAVPCPRCGASHPIRHYLPLAVGGLLGAMDDAIRTATADPDSQTHGPHHAVLAVAVFVSTLEELLVEQLLDELLTKEGIRVKGGVAVMGTVRSFERRQSLIKKLTGMSWNEALGADNLVGYLKRVREFRNELVHSGQRWAVPDDLMPNVATYTLQLLTSFVQAHNGLVAAKPSNDNKDNDKAGPGQGGGPWRE